MTVLNFEELPNNIPFDSVVSINTKNVTSLTHGFHKYPGKFIPQIPEWAIRTYLNGSGKFVLDPFSGSGTSLVQTLIQNHNGYGIDIDPLSCLISKVKSTPLESEVFLDISDWILSKKDNCIPKFYPKTNNLNHWFTDDAIHKLRIIRTLIDLIPNEFSMYSEIEDYYDAFIIAFSSIIRRVSNADNQSQKTYVSGTKIKKPAEVFSLFAKQLGLYFEGFRLLEKTSSENYEVKIFKSDGSPDFSTIIPNQVDLIVTSPPYIKSIDYVYNQMVELFWVGDLFEMDTQVKQNIKRKLYAGTTLVRKVEYKDISKQSLFITIDLLNECINDILKDEKNGEKHAYIVLEYFKFMNTHFEASSKVLKKDSVYVMAVGNSMVSNVNVNTASILIELADRYDLVLENRWSYIIKNHYMGFDRKNRGGKIKEDHMLIFRKKNC
ncbi:hypothetical protein ACTQ5J_13080 [Fundicoccus sp. Sow4_F4]|uniref:hypothetical protein n=1 Tax=Fundicoccus sp. Sow4_F4 TaxID=3438783 RepID=UPI003F905F5B